MLAATAQQTSEDIGGSALHGRAGPHETADENGFRADPLIRLAAGVMDPTRGVAVPPPRLTVAELIALADRDRDAP